MVAEHGLARGAFGSRETPFQVCGPRGRHDPDGVANRHGSEAGSVTLGGRRVPITRPRVRAVDGSGEVPVPAYELFSSTEIMGRMALERMLAGVSTRHDRSPLRWTRVTAV